MSERSLTARILKDLKARKCWALKVQGGSWQRAGVPDILACMEGMFVGLEIKEQGNKSSKLQQREIRLINDAGGLAVVIESWEEYLELMQLCNDALKLLTPTAPTKSLEPGLSGASGAAE